MEEMNRLFSILRFPFLHFFLSWLTSDISRSQHEASKDRQILAGQPGADAVLVLLVCVCVPRFTSLAWQAASSPQARRF